jgi:hypothetical protein
MRKATMPSSTSVVRTGGVERRVQSKSQGVEPVTALWQGWATALPDSKATFHNAVVSGLTDRSQAPRFEEAFRFEDAESLSEKKSFIHRRAADVEKQQATILQRKDQRWRTSSWDYDRIIYSLCLERRVKALGQDLPEALARATEHATAALEKAWARERTDETTDDSHLISLSYALAPLECAPRRSEFARRGELEYLASATRALLRQGRARRHDGNARNRYEGLKAVIEDSLKRIGRVFQLGGDTDADSMPQGSGSETREARGAPSSSESPAALAGALNGTGWPRPVPAVGGLGP